MGEPRFDQPLVSGGYLWWYVDALSQCGQYGLTLIAFVGSVFSPYYRRARRNGLGDPTDHCALNVALYNPTHHRWAMTERGKDLCHRTASAFQLGPSHIEWDGQSLRFQINERGVPLPHVLQGEVRIWPQALHPQVHALDADERHGWGPIATQAHIEVNFQRPDLSWRGQAYLDANQGSEPIDAGFTMWDWSRALLPDGSTLVNYDMHGAEHPDRLLRFRYAKDGSIEALDEVPAWSLPPSRWRVARQVRSEAPARAIQTLEDTPFYQRGLVSQTHAGQEVMAFHESLSVPRLTHPLVQHMLPWRMPRKTRA